MEFMLVILSLLFGWPMVVSFLLIMAYIFLHKKCQWPISLFLSCIIISGIVGFVVAIIATVKFATAHPGSQAPLAILYYGPNFIAIGELAGFALFAWLVARKRRRINGEA